MGKTATGRPRQPLPWPLRLLLSLFLLVGLLELLVYLLGTGVLEGFGDAQLRLLLVPVLDRYWPLRTWVVAHPWQAGATFLVALVVLLVAFRYWLLFWHNQVVSRLTGTKFTSEDLGFPMCTVDLLEHIRQRPQGKYFVGLTPTRGFLRWRWQPVYLTQRQRTMHRHVLGKTGSGKTLSVLWPAVLQDTLDGKGAAVLDAKGSDENVRTMKGIAALAGRLEQLKVFALPAWNEPSVFSHTYNMIYVRPRPARDLAGGDVAATAERVFSVLPLGDNEYYNTQAQIMFTNLCRLMHGILDESGVGLPFVLRDVWVAFKGLTTPGGWDAALKRCLKDSIDRDAALAVEAQRRQLGNDVNKAFSGVVGAIEKFLSPLVNAYDPDIVFEDILQTNGIVYVQLPGNLFKIQAPAMGKVMLMDIQQEGSLRQVFRSARNQNPFAVTVDEFYNFADISIIDSLNKLRDANLEYTLAHQSIADLELVSKEFATAVWDNTRTKDVLNQDNPELCEKISKSIGTHQIVEKTVRMQQGALFTSLTTGDASSKLVETFRLHPNAIKSLERAGQGYLFSDEGLTPVVYGMMPPVALDVALPKKDQTKARGLRLYETFVSAQGGSAASPVAVA